MGDPYEGAVGYEEFVEWKEATLAIEPTTLHEVALKHLFGIEIEGVYFWESAEEDEEWEDEE